jgi:hypothetical protein
LFVEDNKLLVEEMSDEPAKKRQKSHESNGHEIIETIQLSTCDHEEEENHLDKQIEQEENKADNIVIKDLMGSVKPEPNKVIQGK